MDPYLIYLILQNQLVIMTMMSTDGLMSAERKRLKLQIEMTRRRLEELQPTLPRGFRHFGEVPL